MNRRIFLPTQILAIAALCSSGNSRAGGGCEEGFNDALRLTPRGWITRNNSLPLGPTGWYQGNPLIFSAWSGPSNSYIVADANSSSGDNAVISDWLLTPEVDFGPNDFNVRMLDFYTRATAVAPNRLLVRLCVMGDSQHCDAPGPTWSDVGGYDTILLDINPDLTPSGYPEEWTEYTLTPADGVPVVGRGRIAFHYYATPQATGNTGSYIGIDAVMIAGATACPFTDVVLVSGFEPAGSGP